MSPAVPIALLALTAVSWGVSIFADADGRPRLALLGGVAGFAFIITMLATVDDVDWGHPPVPGPAPTVSPAPVYDPETCMDLAWLDGRWTCIPRDEAG